MIQYKLDIELAKRKMKKTDLLAIITSPTLASLSKNEGVHMETIDKICEFLQCQPGDLMEWVPNPNDEIGKEKLSKGGIRRAKGNGSIKNKSQKKKPV